MPFKSNADSIAPTTREYKLPSGGFPYQKAYPGFPNTVVISPYGFDTEAVLGTNLPYYHKLAHITGQVVGNFPSGFDPKNLLAQDVIAIMTLARSLSYGDKYPFRTTCPECGNQEKHEVLVPDELPVKIWTKPEDVSRVLVLPRLKDKVELRSLTLGEEQEIHQAHKTVSKQMTEEAAAKSGAGSSGIIRMAKRVVSINSGAPDTLDDVIQWLRKHVKGEDMTALTDGIKEFECGVRFDWTIICDACGHNFNTYLPISLEFFRGSGA